MLSEAGAGWPVYLKIYLFDTRHVVWGAATVLVTFALSVKMNYQIILKTDK